MRRRTLAMTAAASALVLALAGCETNDEPEDEPVEEETPEEETPEEEETPDA